jgi:hypothetical protein
MPLGEIIAIILKIIRACEQNSILSEKLGDTYTDHYHHD